MPKMRVVQVSRPNGPLEIVEREIPEPGAGEAYERMLTGKARFRMIITTGS
jgi:D-arabinose 1-dehydrogenase-like Zn-dependent alcohol dehydrogenase